MSRTNPLSQRSSTVKIVPLRLHQAKQAHAVFTDALLHHFDHFDDGYKRTVLAENKLRHMVGVALRPSRLMLVAQDGRRIVGYIIGSAPADRNGQIYWLFVDPAYRGQNLGLTLLSSMLKEMTAKGARQAALVTHDHAKYYARHGFRLVKTIPDGEYTKYVLTYDLTQA